MNTLHRFSCRLVTDDQLAYEIAWLNDIGWVVTNTRQTNRINELALQCIYIGPAARRLQMDFYKIG